MSQRTPKICQPRGKIQIPINGEDCLYWLIPVNSVSDIENPTRDFAWITPQGVMYVFDGKKIVPINDPNTLKVQFQNILGNPYDNGALTNALNQKVSNIRMNGQIISQGAGNIVDLGCLTTCDDLENAIETLDLLHVEIVNELPETGDEKTAYLVPKADDPSLYILYFFKENEYREVGTKFVPTDIVKDWNENDPTSVNYIENRTHYVDESGVVNELDIKYIQSHLNTKISRVSSETSGRNMSNYLVHVPALSTREFSIVIHFTDVRFWAISSMFVDVVDPIQTNITASVVSINKDVRTHDYGFKFRVDNASTTDHDITIKYFFDCVLHYGEYE